MPGNPVQRVLAIPDPFTMEFPHTIWRFCAFVCFFLISAYSIAGICHHSNLGFVVILYSYFEKIIPHDIGETHSFCKSIFQLHQGPFAQGARKEGNVMRRKQCNEEDAKSFSSPSLNRQNLGLLWDGPWYYSVLWCCNLWSKAAHKIFLKDLCSWTWTTSPGFHNQPKMKWSGLKICGWGFSWLLQPPRVQSRFLSPGSEADMFAKSLRTHKPTLNVKY